MRVQRFTLFLLPLILLCFPRYSQAQLWSGILAPTRAIDWTHAGAGTIPSGSWTQCGSTIAAYLGSATTINNALAACGANQYVLLGSGTFSLSSGIVWSVNGVVLRGSGPTRTKLVFSGGAHSGCGGENSYVCIVGRYLDDQDNPTNIANWTGGYAQGATSITLSALTAGSVAPFVGTTLRLDQLDDGTTRAADNGNVYNCIASAQCTQAGGGGNGRHGRQQQQWVTVTSVSGTGPYTVGISPGLYMPNWRSGQTPQAWWPNLAYTTNDGIEDLTIDGSADTGALGNMAMYNVKNSWVKNVASLRYNPSCNANANNCVGNTQRGIRLFYTQNITLRDSYFYGRVGRDDYAFNCYECGDTLVENNIIQNIGTTFLNENGHGNVFGYNFAIRNNWGPDLTWAQGSVYGHGSNENFFLAEGNVVYSAEFENYFGHAFFVTSFRNRYNGFYPGQQSQTVPALQYQMNRYFNWVGNVLGVANYHNTYQTLANGNPSNCAKSIFAIGLGGNCDNGNGGAYPLDDSTAVTTTMRWGNYAACSGDGACNSNRFVSAEVPSGISPYPNPVPANNNLPPSFYLNGKPSWWSAGKPWPAIGPDVSGGNIGVCSGGAYNGNQATSSSQCTGGSLASAGLNGQAYSNPAMDCYFSIGGTPDGSGSQLTTFDANSCYGSQPPPPPPPAGLAGVAH